MTQLPVPRPLDEAGFHDDLRTHPVRSQTWQSLRLRKRRRRNLEGVQPPAEVQQQRIVEAGAELPGKAEILTLEVADEQRAEPDALSLRIGEAADDERVRLLALHLQPLLRAAMLVLGVAPLGDDALPPFGAGALPGLRIVERRHLFERQPERQLTQERAALVERQGGQIPSVEPQDVEHVVIGFAERFPAPGGFAVEDHVVDRQVRDRLYHCGVRIVQRQPVAREQPDIGAILERDHADPVELPLEDPLRPGEAVLGQRRRHRLEPFGKGSRHVCSQVRPNTWHGRAREIPPPLPV
jgi:hypothetical protein